MLCLETQSTPGMSHSFDSRSITIVEHNDSIYKVFNTTDIWGKLSVTKGVRVKWIGKNYFYYLSPPIKHNDKLVEGTGWKLELNSGWQVQKTKGYWEISKTN